MLLKNNYLLILNVNNGTLMEENNISVENKVEI